MTSSREFQPVWPPRNEGQLTDLALPSIPSAKPGAGPAEPAASWPLPDLHERAAKETVPQTDAVAADTARQAFEKGFADGIEQGIAQTYEKITPAVAKHLIQREVRADPTIVRDLVEQALDLVPNDVALEVRLNPDDLAAIDDQLSRVGAGGRPLHAQWIADASLDRGSFLLETPLRVVDGRADIALRSLYDRLSHD